MTIFISAICRRNHDHTKIRVVLFFSFYRIFALCGVMSVLAPPFSLTRCAAVLRGCGREVLGVVYAKNPRVTVFFFTITSLCIKGMQNNNNIIIIPIIL